MDDPIALGIDLARSVLQLHGVDSEGRALARRPRRRAQMRGCCKGPRPERAKVETPPDPDRERCLEFFQNCRNGNPT